MGDFDMMTRESMSRVLYRHNWDSLDDWVDALNDLADLSDDDIDDVVRIANREPDAVFFQ
jgi:hypothetical protein